MTESTYATKAERDLIVTIWPKRHGMWDFKGSRAQLEAEGVIPPDFEWPRLGDDRAVYWELGHFSYLLRRIRPDGVKGPKKVWANIDWWFIRGEVTSKSVRSLLILEKEAELREEIWRQSPAGSLEIYTRSQMFWRAQSDRAFLSFKAKVPGLILTKRRRASKAQEMRDV